AVSAERGEPSSAPSIHAAERDHRQRRSAGEPGEAGEAERLRVGVTSRGIDRREEDEGGSVALGGAALRIIVAGGAPPAAPRAPGQSVFGENRVQGAQEKWPALRARRGDLRLHLIGRLQSNKAEDAAALFDAIHSIDRPSLVEALAKAVAKLGRGPDCFIQVN